MSTAVLVPAPQQSSAYISMEEYLRTSYHPDVDYVDGFLEERNVGEFDHGSLQIILGGWFHSHRSEWNIRVAAEWRTRVSATRVRVPDVCIQSLNTPREQVGVTAPLLCIEVRSPEDRPSRILRVFADYARMGVKNLWLIDPSDRTAMVYLDGGLRLFEGTRLVVEETPIYLDLPNLFSSLDEDQK